MSHLQGCKLQLSVYGPFLQDNNTLRVQVPKHKVSTPNHNSDSQYRNLKHPVYGYFGILGIQTPLPNHRPEQSEEPQALKVLPQAGQDQHFPSAMPGKLRTSIPQLLCWQALVIEHHKDLIGNLFKTTRFGRLQFLELPTPVDCGHYSRAWMREGWLQPNSAFKLNSCYRQKGCFPGNQQNQRSKTSPREEATSAIFE